MKLSGPEYGFLVHRAKKSLCAPVLGDIPLAVFKFRDI